MIFSVVTPSRNALRGLRRCIGSVRGQSQAMTEHIVMDGGSTDGTVPWLTQWQDRTTSGTGSPVPGVPAFRWTSEPDHGMYDAINKGWAQARGDILSWLNCDEQYLPDTLTRVAASFAANPGTDIVFGDTLIVTPDGSPLASRREIPLRASYVRNGFLYSLSCSTFFHRRLWDAGLLQWNGHYRYAADMDLMLRLLDKGRRVLHLPCHLALFGVDGANLSTTRAKEMATEVERIRRTYHARTWLLRLPYRMLRCVERLLRGCYLTTTVHYAFATDEQPQYRHITPTRVGFRFTYARAARRLAAGDPPTPAGEI